MTVSAGSIVDAAHIHQFADSRNNDPRNGLALCKNAHWLFDEGLWSIDDDYRVIVASHRFHETGPVAMLLAEHVGERIRLPCERTCWPEHSYLAWHRQNRFAGAPAPHGRSSPQTRLGTGPNEIGALDRLCPTGCGTFERKLDGRV